MQTSAQNKAWKRLDYLRKKQEKEHAKQSGLFTWDGRCPITGMPLVEKVHENAGHMVTGKFNSKNVRLWNN